MFASLLWAEIRVFGFERNNEMEETGFTYSLLITLAIRAAEVLQCQLKCRRYCTCTALMRLEPQRCRGEERGEEATATFGSLLGY